MTDSSNHQIKFRGKLPNSSYYETTSAVQTTPIMRITNNNNQQQQQTPPLANQDQNSGNTNLYVRSCVFSPDGTHLAWTCGYGIVKIMKWKESTTRKRTISAETMLSSYAMPSPQSPKKIHRTYIESTLSADTPTTAQSVHLTNVLMPSSTSLSSPTSVAGANIISDMNTNNSPVILNDDDYTINNIDEIAEIDCSEQVFSLAFGSTKSFVKHRRDLHRQSRVNTRFNFGQINLILAVGLNSGKIRIYNGMTGVFLLGLFDHKEICNDLKFTKDGTLQLASVSNDQTIKLWDLHDDGNMYKTLKHHIGKVLACDWSPTASLLCSVGVNRQAFIWDTESFNVKHVLRGHLHDVVKCEFSPDGAVVATGSYDTKICLWDPYSGGLIRQLYHMLPPPRSIYASGYNDAYIRSFAFSKGGDHLVSVCDDKKLRIWSLCSRSIHPIAEASQTKGICCAYSSDSKTIMIGNKNGHVDIYEAPIMIQRLVDICRKVVNQYVDHEQISKLALPNELKRFLLYDDIRDLQNQSANLNSSSPSQSTPSSHSVNQNSMSPLSAYHQSATALCN